MNTNLLSLLGGLCISALSALSAQDAPPSGSQAIDIEVRAAKMLEAAAEVAKEVETLRGWKFKQPVRNEVRTEAQLREFIQKKLFEEEYAGGRLPRAEAWLKTMGLIPEDASFAGTIMDVLISQVGGFYDPKEKAFFMMAESARFGDTVNRMLIAHELCHALDDQYVDLGKMMKDGSGGSLTDDESFAIGGVVEGSATALMFAWMKEKMQAGEVDMAEMLELQKAEAERNKTLLEAPRYFTLIVANYMVGQHFITKGVGAMTPGGKGDTGASIEAVAKDLPRSTEQLLHPEKYWDADARDEPVRVADDDALAEQIASWAGTPVIERNTLGELVAALVSTSDEKKLNLILVAQPTYWTNKYARGWGGDRLYLAGEQEGDGPVSRAGAVWVTAWDTAADREEFVAGVKRVRGGRCRVVEEGRVAVFGFGSCASDDADLAGVLRQARFTKDGAAWSAN